jgi:hypothetical protein
LTLPEVRFVDTSVLCDLLAVPGKCQQQHSVRDELQRLIEDRVQLVLPIATVIETGNHIAQAADGRSRRACAERFVALLRETAAGRLPWVLHSVAWDAAMLEALCDGVQGTGSFVELAGAGLLGTGDLSILVERDLYRHRTSGIQVTLWTHDDRLRAYG